MYFLATCITVQSYLIFDLVQSPQVLIHLHVFLDYIYYSSVLSQFWFGPITTSVVPFTCISWLHVLQFSPVLVLIWSNHHKCCSIYMYFLATCITVQSYPSLDLIQSPQVLFHLHVFLGHMYYSSVLSYIWFGPITTSVDPFTCISWLHVLQFSPILDLIWSNHHKCCSIYMYFLATYITVQSYPSLDLVQSPQVLFHLHVFPGHMYYSSVLS